MSEPLSGDLGTDCTFRVVNEYETMTFNPLSKPKKRPLPGQIIKLKGKIPKAWRGSWMVVGMTEDSYKLKRQIKTNSQTK